MSYTQLKDEIKKATSKAFSELLKLHQDEHFFAFVLSTLDDHNYINASANSLESYQRIKEKNHSEEPYLKWSPTEWEYEYTGQEYFTKVDQLLESISSTLSDSEFESHCKKVYEAMKTALEELDDEEFFCKENERESIYLFLTVYDSENTEKYENDSSRYLNPTETHNLFIDRYITSSNLDGVEKSKEEKQATKKYALSISLKDQNVNGNQAVAIKNAIEEQIESNISAEVTGCGAYVDGSAIDFTIATNHKDELFSFIKGLMDHTGLTSNYKLDEL